jgi:hypothetical protein
MKASIENIKNQLKALDDNMVDFVSTQKDIRNMEDIIH